MADENPVELLSTLESGGYLILGFVIVGVLIFVGYEVYELGTPAKDALDKLFSYLGLGTGPADPSKAPAKSVPGGGGTIQSDYGGYDMVGNDGNTYSCNSSNMCTPMTCDANNNCTATGTAVPASTIGG